MNPCVKRCRVKMRDGAPLYTAVLLPEGGGRYPAIFLRSPYVDPPSDDAAEESWLLAEFSTRLASGFAVVFQHCRGHGGSAGEAIPFIHEKDDGLDAIDWIVKQPWYSGGIYLEGASYLAYAHLSYMGRLPGEVKAAALSVMPTRADIGFYVNGVYKSDIGPEWYVYMLKGHVPPCDPHQAPALYWKANPASEYMKRVYGYDIPAFTAPLLLDERDPAGWEAYYGQLSEVMRSVQIQILLKDGWFEMYLAGMIDMWRQLPPETRAKSALILGPWGHGCEVNPAWEFPLPDGNLPADSTLEWFLHVRDGKTPACAKAGKARCYVVGEGRWIEADDIPEPKEYLELFLNPAGGLAPERPPREQVLYTYDPEDPASFPGGAKAFHTEPAGLVRQPPPSFRRDVLSFISPAFQEDTPLFGPIRALLRVKSDCEDTAFLIRASAMNAEGEAFFMQESIATLGREFGEYRPGGEVEIALATDPVLWTLHSGERVRLDVASANAVSYRPHTNTAGPWATRAETKIAHNVVFTGTSKLLLPLRTD